MRNTFYYFTYDIPELCLEMLIGRVDKDLYCSREVYDLLDKQEYRNLGWLNGGAQKTPGVEYTMVYRSDSGSTCIYVNHQFREYYSVDMGD